MALLKYPEISFFFFWLLSEWDKMWRTGGHHRILFNHFTYVEHKVFKDKAVEINVYIKMLLLTLCQIVWHIY